MLQFTRIRVLNKNIHLTKDSNPCITKIACFDPFEINPHQKYNYLNNSIFMVLVMIPMHISRLLNAI